MRPALPKANGPAVISSAYCPEEEGTETGGQMKSRGNIGATNGLGVGLLSPATDSR